MIRLKITEETKVTLTTGVSSFAVVFDVVFEYFGIKAA